MIVQCFILLSDSFYRKGLANGQHPGFKPHSKMQLQESGFGAGIPEGRDLSSGNGMNSLLSFGGSTIRPFFQSALACSIRSFRDDTKFHQIKRSPSDSPPSSITVDFSVAVITASAPAAKTSICPLKYCE